MRHSGLAARAVALQGEAAGRARLLGARQFLSRLRPTRVRHQEQHHGGTRCGPAAHHTGRLLQREAFESPPLARPRPALCRPSGWGQGLNTPIAEAQCLIGSATSLPTRYCRNRQATKQTAGAAACRLGCYTVAKKAVLLGAIEAPDTSTAIEKAAQEFKTEAWRLYAVQRR